MLQKREDRALMLDEFLHVFTHYINEPQNIWTDQRRFFSRMEFRALG